MHKMFKVSIEGGQAYIKPMKDGGIGGSGAFLNGAMTPVEFSSHIDYLIKDLERVRAEGMRLLEAERAKPIITGQ